MWDWNESVLFLGSYTRHVLPRLVTSFELHLSETFRLLVSHHCTNKTMRLLRLDEMRSSTFIETKKRLR